MGGRREGVHGGFVGPGPRLRLDLCGTESGKGRWEKGQLEKREMQRETRRRQGKSECERLESRIGSQGAGNPCLELGWVESRNNLGDRGVERGGSGRETF